MTQLFFIFIRPGSGGPEYPRIADSLGLKYVQEIPSGRRLGRAVQVERRRARYERHRPGEEDCTLVLGECPEPGHFSIFSLGRACSHIRERRRVAHTGVRMQAASPALPPPFSHPASPDSRALVDWQPTPTPCLILQRAKDSQQLTRPPPAPSGRLQKHQEEKPRSSGERQRGKSTAACIRHTPLAPPNQASIRNTGRHKTITRHTQEPLILIQ